MAAAALAIAPAAVRAVVLASGDPAANRAAPTGLIANSGWQYQGNFRGFQGTPVAPHYFVTAAHIGGGTGDSFSLNGETHQTVAFSDGASFKDFGDLRLYRVDAPFHAYAPLYDALADGDESGLTNDSGKNVVVHGKGGIRGNEVRVPQPDGTLKGWEWGAGGGQLRWGENRVTSLASFATVGDNKLLKFNFDRSGAGYTGTSEAHLAEGDSGGGVFARGANNEWKLAGISYAVSGPYRVPERTVGETTYLERTISAALFDTGGLLDANGNTISDTAADKPSSWYATRISANLAGLKDWIDLAPTWKSDADGATFGNLLNWDHNGPPAGAGAIAGFRTYITQPRTISVGAATIGTIDFDNVNRYTLAPSSGSSAITLDAAGGSASINVAAGSHTVSVPLVLNDPLTLGVVHASSTLTVAAAPLQGQAITKRGDGTADVRAVRGPLLDVQAGKLKVLSNGTATGTSKVNALIMGGGATLDVTNNDVIIDYAGGASSPLGGLLAKIQAGRDGGTWAGAAGITSSTAAAAATTPAGGRTAVAIAEASDVLGLSGAQTAAWSGQTVDASSVLLKYTWAGDADLNGKINGDDYFRIDSNINAPGASGWSSGDFDYNGRIDGDDYFLIDSNMAAPGATLSQPMTDSLPAGGVAGVSAVPEPATAALLAAGSAALLLRRRGPRARAT
ncbi:MAG TPA: PEP-CTERM sorting domain-containing protein [Tepidisphaeraceae bacterium]|nr:PEP-CTERM sorting domain-containing protein [Tepidisphaeraceae bacterium]